MKAELFLTRISDRHPKLKPFLRPLIYAKHSLYQFVKSKIIPLAKQRLLSDEAFIKQLFYKKLGYEPSLSNPKTFNEKMQWLKINDRTPKHTMCADKYAVREFIRTELGEQYLIPLLRHTDDLEEITRESLPDEPCIIKTTHDSGNYFVVRDKKNITDNEWQIFKSKFEKSIHRNYYYCSREWQYKHIKSKIIIEKLLLENGTLPNDYKFYCFNGKSEFVLVDFDKHTDHKRNFYDVNWRQLELRRKYPNGKDVPRPKCLEEMICLAEKLAEQFCFLRVDFYEVNGCVYFGEMTFHPASGFGAFEPKEWDLKLGQKLRLPTNHIPRKY